MKNCDICGHELFAMQGEPAKTIVLNSNTPEAETKLILRQYLTCRNKQCTNYNKKILNTVNLNFTEE